MSADIRAALRLDKSQFSRGIAEAKSEGASLKDVARSIKGELAGAFSAGALVAFVRSQGQAAKEIINFSHAVGVSTVSLQALDDAAEDNGSSSERMRAALVKLNQTLGEARAGSVSAREAFSRLGLSDAVVQGGSLAEVLQAVATAWNTAGSDAQVYASIQDVLGRSAAELKDTLNQIATQTLPGLTEAFAKSGKGMSDETLTGMRDAVKEMDDAIAIVKGRASQALVGAGKLLAAGWAIETGNFKTAVEVFTDNDAPKLVKTDAERKKMRDDAESARLAGLQQQGDADRAQRSAALSGSVDSITKIGREMADAFAKEWARQDAADRQGKNVRDSARREYASIFSAVQRDITPASELNRIGGFIGGKRDKDGEHLAQIARLQKEAARIQGEMKQKLTDIEKNTRKGPEQI